MHSFTHSFSILILLIVSCKSAPKVTAVLQPGMYGPVSPAEREELGGRKLGPRLPLMSMEFRKDSVYIMHSNCSNTIKQSGKWRVNGDSVLLYERIAGDSAHKAWPDKNIYYDGKYVYYKYSYDNETVAVLRIGGNYK